MIYDLNVYVNKSLLLQNSRMGFEVHLSAGDVDQV